MVGLGLTSGRAAVAIYKVQEDLPLDAIDRVSLSEIDVLLRNSAETVRFFDSKGQSGTPPTEPLALPIEIAIRVAVKDPMATDETTLEASLERIADSIRRVIETGQANIDIDLYSYFMRLSRSALQETASVGEIAGRL